MSNVALLLDTETTGMNEPIIPVEIAYTQILDARCENIGEEFCKRYAPGKPIEVSAMATHHIIDADLQDADPISSFSLPAETEYLIGHNIDYDWVALGKPEVKRICTLALARRLFPEWESHSLSSAMFYLLEHEKARDMVRSAHSALFDVRMNIILLQAIMEKMPKVNTFEILWSASEKARIPVIMPFGKHKGVPIRDLPSDYCSWLLRQPDMDPYLLTAIRNRVS